MTGPDHHAEMEAHFAAGMERQEQAFGRALTDEINALLETIDHDRLIRMPASILRDDVLDLTLEDMHRHLHQRLGTPRGLFWPETHTEICKAAERVTRQQRRYQERQRRKRR